MTIKAASVLAFERKLSNSDGLMYEGNWNDIQDSTTWKPIKIKEKDVRGTISNRLKASLQKDPAKLDAEIQKANLQRVDVAALSFESNTLKVSFSLRVIGDLETPSACNEPDYQKALKNLINEYSEEYAFKELSLRYANNIANGRFLWRNQVGAEDVRVIVRQLSNQKCENEWEFNSNNFSMRKFNKEDKQIQELAKTIENGLSGKSFIFLEIDGYVRLGNGQEVFPSQELVLDNSQNNKKSKVLYHIDEIAGIHSQKIGNAIRTIDTWYPDSDVVGPIAIEPYGAVTNRGKAYRQPKDKMDFYTILDKWILKGEKPAPEQQHYVIANLIRGGVFGGKGE